MTKDSKTFFAVNLTPADLAMFSKLGITVELLKRAAIERVTDREARGVMTFQSVRDGYASGRPGMALLLINWVIDLLLFCGFFAFALIFRGRKEIHKRLMMLAMISLIIPALGRFPVPGGMIKWVICAFSLTGVIYDLVFLRRLYLTNIVGALLINAGSPLRFMIADTEAWQKFSEWFTR